MPDLFHLVDVSYSDARTAHAQLSWPVAYAEGIIPIRVANYPRSARAIGDLRPLPYLKDLLENFLLAGAEDTDLCCWTNSDIALKPGIASALRSHLSQHTCCSMRRTESNGHGHPGRDLFAFSAGWLRSHWDEIPDYILGAPVFDLGLVCMIRKHHNLPCDLKTMNRDLHPAEMEPGYALHESHAPSWQTRPEPPSALHNKTCFMDWAARYAPELCFNAEGNLK